MLGQATAVDHLEGLRAFVHQTLLATSPLTPFQTHRPRRAVDGNVVFIAGEQPGPDYNVVSVLGAEPAQRVFTLAAEFFHLPPAHVLNASAFGVELKAETATEVEAALRALGWRLEEEEPALVMAPLPDNIPQPPAELTIRRVTTEEELAVWRTVSRTGPRWVPSVTAATAPGVAVFLGEVDGHVVATSRVACMGEPPLRVADINGVVTLEAYRRRGYGTAMTWETVCESSTCSCTRTCATPFSSVGATVASRPRPRLSARPSAWPTWSISTRSSPNTARRSKTCSTRPLTPASTPRRRRTERVGACRLWTPTSMTVGRALPCW